MELIEIEMYNFRQYLGDNKICFSRGDFNTTVILGENGKGKTGIYRAVMFSLYGLRKIQQDDSREEVRLVNRILIQKNNMAEATVRVKFEHQKSIFTIERVIKGITINNRYEESIFSVKLSSLDSDGNYSIVSEEELEIEAFMERIMGRQIKDFFIFDGEKIDTLVKTDDVVKKEVKTAIQKLLQLDDLEQSLKYLITTEQSLRQEISKKSSNMKIGEINELIVNNSIDLEKLYKEKKELESELRDAKLITYELDESLKENEITSKLLQEYNAKKLEYTLLNEKLEYINGEIVSECLDNISSVFLKNTYMSVDKMLEQASLDISLLIPVEVFKHSLETEFCACCETNISSDDSAKHAIKKNLEKNLESGTGSIFTSVRGFILNDLSNIDVKKSKVQKNAKVLYEIDEQISGLKLTMKTIQEKLGSSFNTNIDISNTKNSYLEAVGVENSAEDNLIKINKEIDAKNVAKSELNQMLLEEIEKDSLINNLKNERNFVENLRIKLIKISTEFNDEVREILNKKTTELFKKMIDSKDDELITEVYINDKFELELIGRDKEIINQDISQGQRHIMSLAFIMALAEVAAGSEEVASFPFFMDSPFNRLSGNNRDNIIRIIPTLVSQWILLLTDTELTVAEEKVLKDTNKLGKYYVIDQIEPFHAVIEEKSIDILISKRGFI